MVMNMIIIIIIIITMIMKHSTTGWQSKDTTRNRQRRRTKQLNVTTTNTSRTLSSLVEQLQSSIQSPMTIKMTRYTTAWLPHKKSLHCSATQHSNYGDCLEVKREYYQNCSVLGSVTQCSQSAAHSYEQFLQVQQIGFVTLGPLRHA